MLSFLALGSALFSPAMQTPDGYKATFSWGELMRVTRVVAKALGSQPGKTIDEPLLIERIKQVAKETTNEYEKYFSERLLSDYRLVFTKDAASGSQFPGYVKIYHKFEDTYSMVNRAGDTKVFRHHGRVLSDTLNINERSTLF